MLSILPLDYVLIAIQFLTIGSIFSQRGNNITTAFRSNLFWPSGGSENALTCHAWPSLSSDLVFTPFNLCCCSLCLSCVVTLVRFTSVSFCVTCFSLV